MQRPTPSPVPSLWGWKSNNNGGPVEPVQHHLQTQTPLGPDMFKHVDQWLTRETPLDTRYTNHEHRDIGSSMSMSMMESDSHVPCSKDFYDDDDNPPSGSASDDRGELAACRSIPGLLIDPTERYPVNVSHDDVCESPPHQLQFPSVNKRKAECDHFSEDAMLAKRLAVDLSIASRREGIQKEVMCLGDSSRRKILKSKRKTSSVLQDQDGRIGHRSSPRLSRSKSAGVIQAFKKQSNKKTTHVLVPLKLEQGYDAGDELEDEDVTRKNNEEIEEYLICPHELIESSEATRDLNPLAMVPFRSPNQRARDLLRAVKEYTDQKIEIERSRMTLD